ncbi:uncharacterized protein PAC_11864 [Phialocephala subalpina]|uniref:Uncharacterized protein n=1 Tax=Phialocephala subalpina TaxID=576137 RepID=A0A1L7XAG6_9HELO|nr:uncharacterized protein PAC_11864 [Phialocephala subalpina]
MNPGATDALHSSQPAFNPDDTIVVDTSATKYDFGDRPGETLMWFGTYEGHPSKKLAMGYRQRCIILREIDDSEDALHHEYNAWRDKRQSPLTETVWFGEYEGHPFTVLNRQKMKWDFCVRKGNPENRRVIIEIKQRYLQWKSLRPKRTTSTRTSGAIANKKGQLLGPKDDLPPSDNEDYEADEEWLDKNNSQPDPDGDYVESTQDESPDASQQSQDTTPPDSQESTLSVDLDLDASQQTHTAEDNVVIPQSIGFETAKGKGPASTPESDEYGSPPSPNTIEACFSTSKGPQGRMPLSTVSTNTAQAPRKRLDNKSMVKFGKASRRPSALAGVSVVKGNNNLSSLTPSAKFFPAASLSATPKVPPISQLGLSTQQTRPRKPASTLNAWLEAPTLKKRKLG